MWLCDKGWFGYEFTDHPERLQKPLIRRNGKLEQANWEEALALVASEINKAKPNGKLAGFGGNPLTVEENYLFQKLMRDGAGVNNIDHRIGMPLMSLEEEGMPPGMEMSIGECEELSFVLVLGLDITEEFPVIWLRMKQAINRGAKVIFIGHYAPEISQLLAETIVHSPGKELEMLKLHLPQIISQIPNEKKGAIFVGRQYLDTLQRSTILSELMNVRQQSPNLTLNLMEGRGNSFGARLAGMRPDIGPLGEKISQPGLNALQVLETAATSGWDYLHIAGADPATKYSSKLWQEARAKIGFMVVQELFLTETAKQADVVFPALCFVEKEGSFINIEGRVQKLQAGKDLPYGIYSDADIFTLLALRLNSIITLDEIFIEALQKGMKIPPDRSQAVKEGPVYEEKSHSGGLSATFAPALFDHGVRMKHNLHVVELAAEPRLRLNPAEAAKLKIKDDDHVRVKANDNLIEGQVRLDSRVPEGTLVLPLGYPEIHVHDLDVKLMNGLEVEIKFWFEN